MNNLVLLVVMMLTIPLLIYLGCILILRQFFHKTGEEAKKTVDNALTKIINLFQDKNTFGVVYDVLIGSNGVYVRDEIVNEKFRGFDSLFDDWYYEMAYYPTANVVCYQFRVYNCKLQKFDKKLVLYRSKQVSEHALISHFHDRGIYNIPADSFIATEIGADILKVYISINDVGFREIEEIRRKPK